MTVKLTFNPLPDGYEPPEVRLEIRLEKYQGTKPRSPVLKGYVKVTAAQLEKLKGVLRATEKDAVFLQVALWDSGDAGGVDGVIEYKEYTGKMVQPQKPEELDSIWY